MWGKIPYDADTLYAKFQPKANFYGQVIYDDKASNLASLLAVAITALEVYIKDDLVTW